MLTDRGTPRDSEQNFSLCLGRSALIFFSFAPAFAKELCPPVNAMIGKEEEEKEGDENEKKTRSPVA